LTATKFWHLQNISADKMFALTNYWHRQNIGVDTILASTEFRRQQNVGACVEASPYFFGPTESTAADFSQTLLMFSYFSQKVLIPPRTVTKCAVAAGRPAFMGGLSPAPARHAQNVTNIGVDKISVPAKITLNW
jgi:hypothetical protein